LERPIDRREHGEGAHALQRIDQACRRDRRDQGGVIDGVNRVVDDGPARQHRLAADDDLRAGASGGGAEQERRGDQRAR
jgi:hypothetical protein